MSSPQPPKPAKLIAGFFLKDKTLAGEVVRLLADERGVRGSPRRGSRRAAAGGEPGHTGEDPHLPRRAW